MKINRLFINNYKSLVNFELVEPNPFSVFVGPNAAGKSNVFEALEFLSVAYQSRFIAANSFGGPNSFLYMNAKPRIFYEIDFKLNIDDIKLWYPISIEKKRGLLSIVAEGSFACGNAQEDDFTKEIKKQIEIREKEFSTKFNRVFLGIRKPIGVQSNSPGKLNIDAVNLEPVLHRILQDEAKREEITEWLELLIPGLEKVEVAKSDLSGDYFLRIFEKHLDEPIGKNLISDGTYNILALLTAVYQSDEPQFLCIEEPENGLNPYVIRSLVGFFRQMCEEKGHYIWLNTHSATLVKELQPKELILINKIDGITQAKQLDPNLKFESMPLDEAWLTNTLGGGLPW